MLIDSFMFYNELDILYYRLNVLYNVVDYFVIVEATLTHAGKPKQLYYNENKERFSKFADKIIHVVVDDLYPNVNTDTNNETFKNENYHRNCIDKGILQIEKIKPLSNDDIILISDADEIPDPTTIQYFYGRLKHSILSLKQDLYYYNLHTLSEVPWYSAKALTFSMYKMLGRSPQNCRMWGGQPITNGGWHLSYFGDSKFIQNKIQSFAEQNFNTPEITNLDNIQKHLENGDDVYGRSEHKLLKVVNQSYIPPKAEEYLKKYM
jgi:beta-1,4-mannosyl-glycoprotein beta-1,4-N-acetylglucosaminyltransferase